MSLGWSSGLEPNPAPLSCQKNEMLIFALSFNFWWLAGLVYGLECHLSPLSSQKILRCSSLDYVQLLIISLAGQWPRHPICHPSPARKMKCSFLDYVHFWWSAGLVDGLEPHLPLLLQPEIWNAHFGIMFNFWWTPICHPSLAKKTKSLLLDYVLLLMIGQAGRWTQTLCSTPPQPKKWNAHFWITFNFWWSAGWSMVSNPFHHPSPAKKTKSLLLDYVQLLMISQAGEWTQTPSATSLQPKKWNAHFWIMFNFW